MASVTVIQRVHDEQGQGPITRKRLFDKLERELGRPVVSYFTSPRHPVMIEDDDADILEGILQKTNTDKGFALFISSHGGDGLAAERIINVCRNASGTGEYWAIIPGKAKSAATMICFGASKLVMAASSELGPIDPQIAVFEDGRVKWFSLWGIVMSYYGLFERAVKEKGNLEPYLQQLAHYDAREIAEYEMAIDLAEDIAVQSLASGMMKGRTAATIKKKIGMFLTPEKKKTHGRPIYRNEAESCGLSIIRVDIKDTLGQLLYELYIRTLNFVQTSAYKCIESKDQSFVAPVTQKVRSR